MVIFAVPKRARPWAYSAHAFDAVLAPLCQRPKCCCALITAFGAHLLLSSACIRLDWRGVAVHYIACGVMAACNRSATGRQKTRDKSQTRSEFTVAAECPIDDVIRSGLANGCEQQQKCDPQTIESPSVSINCGSLQSVREICGLRCAHGSIAGQPRLREGKGDGPKAHGRKGRTKMLARIIIIIRNFFGFGLVSSVSGVVSGVGRKNTIGNGKRYSHATNSS